MVFSSPTFLFIFLPAVFLLNLLFRRNIAWSNALLTVASLLFYAWGEPVYVLLMIATTFVCWLFARLMMKYEGKKKLFLALTAAWGVGILIYFKYTDFLIGSLNGIAGLSLNLAGIALPIGISFFTFQSMSYVFDVYRGDAKVAKSYLDVLLYISLFPQLIAGPIVRYSDIAEQLRERKADLSDVAAGFRRFCFGLAKKALLANTLAITADAVYALPKASVNAPLAWLGAIAYLLQIYFDFSGYSDMAIGLGQAFGFRFLENFQYPYSAGSMQDFWRRWHISLSTWFKEYVYIPLGGNRKGKFRAGLNKLVVFALTGLWHGANWTIAAWGLYHGGFLMLESYGVLKPDRWPSFIRRAYTLLAVTVGFVIFRAETLADGVFMIGRMFAGWRFTPLQNAELSLLLTPLCAAALIVGAAACSPFVHRMGERLSLKFAGYAYGIYAAALALLVLSALCVATSSYNPFIYFRF